MIDHISEYRVADRALFVVVALGWLGVGVFGHAPVLSDNGWVLVCSVPAGASLSMGVHLSRFALRSFVWASFAVGLARPVAYLTEGAEGPLFVWLIVLALVVLVRARFSRLVKT